MTPVAAWPARHPVATLCIARAALSAVAVRRLTPAASLGSMMSNDSPAAGAAVRSALSRLPGAMLTGLSVVSHDMQAAVQADDAD